MKINRVTITGADEDVNILDLIKLNELYPFVEWGVLFSAMREGDPRYPGPSWRGIIANTKKLDNLSAHFCGWWATQVLIAQNFDLITNLHPSFRRVQLNFNFEKSHGFHLEALARYAELHYNKRSIILQFNKANEQTIVNWIGRKVLPKNIHFLYDASGGRGKPISKIYPPFHGNYTGYSGGLRPENIEDVAKEITSQSNYPDEVWLDLETGVRTEDRFDLEKVNLVLSAVKNYIS
jgi:phosphoribosylanthranilate isomerase